jgi:hypothetical protein
VVRGAFFKRIEEEGLGGWAPAPRRCIRTVGITDSAIMLDTQPIYRDAYAAAGGAPAMDATALAEFEGES